jgi:hypothetical protein
LCLYLILRFLLLCCRCRGSHGYGDLGLGLFGRFVLFLVGEEEKVVVSALRLLFATTRFVMWWCS